MLLPAYSMAGTSWGNTGHIQTALPCDRIYTYT